MNTHHEFLYEKRNDSFHDDMRKLSALFEWTLKIFEDYDLDLNELCYVLYKHWKNRIEWQKNSSIICEILDSHNINKDRKYRNCSFYVYYTELLNVWNKSDLDPKRFFTPEQKYEHWKDNHPENYPHEFEYYRDWEMDHKIPWSKGGKTIPNNAQLLKPTENKSKGSKW
jgi:hypothetical protein